jgi:hypothetical protein
MLQNLHLLSNEELHNLFVSETNGFMNGIENDLCFDDLKSIRVNLRSIEAELNKRKIY